MPDRTFISRYSPQKRHALATWLRVAGIIAVLSSFVFRRLDYQLYSSFRIKNANVVLPQENHIGIYLLLCATWLVVMILITQLDKKGYFVEYYNLLPCIGLLLIPTYQVGEFNQFGIFSIACAMGSLFLLWPEVLASFSFKRSREAYHFLHAYLNENDLYWYQRFFQWRKGSARFTLVGWGILLFFNTAVSLLLFVLPFLIMPVHVLFGGIPLFLAAPLSYELMYSAPLKETEAIEFALGIASVLIMLMLAIDPIIGFFVGLQLAGTLGGWKLRTAPYLLAQQ